MKITELFLGASLVANIALVACLVVGISDQPMPRATPPTPTAKASSPAASAAGEPFTAEAWAALQADDLAVQRDRLRAEGFPPSLIRAILAAQVREGFAARRKALDAARGDLPFWKSPTPDPKTQAALRAIAKDEQKALTDLLGPDSENTGTTALQRQFPNLSADKIAQVAAIRDDYNQRRNDIYLNLAGIGGTTPVDQQKLIALEKGLHTDLASVLTPQELQDYDLRTSNVASQLRSNLSGFDATEQEFRTLFQLQQSFIDRFGPQFGPLSPDEMKTRNDAQKQLNDDIKAALGDARYADYQRATDYNYRQTSQLVARLELPPETANQLYALQQDIQQRMRTIQNDGSLPVSERGQQIVALADEAKAKILPLLGGTRGFEAYKQYGGSWLQNMVPRVMPAIRPALPGGG